jgi:hypothetical protein
MFRVVFLFSVQNCEFCCIGLRTVVSQFSVQNRVSVLAIVLNCECVQHAPFCCMEIDFLKIWTHVNIMTRLEL